jgi:post-segregation antitoxin (ccd killing protein)
MPRVNVYIPGELAKSLESLDLNLSQLLQSALRDRIACDRLENWLAELAHTLSPEVSHREASLALDDGEPGVLS